MHSVGFLQDLAVVMIVAGLVTVIFHRLKQPVVLGYILAGVIIGPHTPPFPLIKDEHTIHTLSELGIVFLMFSLGLEFSLKKLKAVGSTAFIGAVLEILLMFFAGYQVGVWFGWSRMDCIFLGAMLSISSTTIIIKALAELGKTKEKFANLIFGILIVEDILAIVMIALLSGIAVTGSFKLADVGATVGRLSVFLVTTLIVGLITVPRLIGFVARYKSNEMLLITVLGLSFGVSLLAVKLGYSVALGAFIIGAVIAEAREIGRIHTLMEPIKDMFSAVFFVSIGLLIEPDMLILHAWPICVITVVVVLGKVLSCSVGTFLAGNSTRTSLKVGMGLAQIGEFSFIIAALGVSLKATSDFLYPIAVTVSVLTTLFTPYLIKSSDALVGLFDRRAPKALVKNLELYTQWVGHLSEGKGNPSAGFIRKWLFQVVLNAALIAAIFLTAEFFSSYPVKWWPRLVSVEKNDLVHWLVAALLSLPLFIASYRKLEAIGLLVADLRMKPGTTPAKRVTIQTVVSQVIAWTGSGVMVLMAMLLSLAMLPHFRAMLVLLPVMGVVAGLMWHSFVKVYSKAQVALQESLAEKPEEHAALLETPAAHLPAILREAKLETIGVSAGSAMAGKLIREAQLRTRVGASVVGIQRQNQSIVNPGPDEEILAGDQVLLIGTEVQLAEARTLFATPA